ncbi:MAG: hypothetical protein HOE86_12460 [Gemmatimonadetes bacterium]|nr:hypothetical protein [Gemmatimonadota bacterium]
MILEILKDLDLLPTLPRGIDDVVFAFEASLRGPAQDVANRLRNAGRSVDLVLEDGKRMKWAFRHADNVGASRIVLLAPDEWAKGVVKVRDLASGKETEVSPADL